MIFPKLRPFLGKTFHNFKRAYRELFDYQSYRESLDHRLYRKIWIDVGSHRGELTFYFAEKDPSLLVYAFEPNLKVAASMFGKLPNFVVLPMAISEKEGCADFWVCGFTQSSSLLPFNQEGLNHWIGGEILKESSKITVPVIRLDTFLDLVGIPKVDFLKIDAQGADFSVIKSTGERIKDIQKITLEVQITSIPLYQGSSEKAAVINYLTDKGFVLRESTLQSSNQEENLTFVRL